MKNLLTLLFSLFIFSISYSQSDLEVEGKTTTDSLQINDGATIGYVLVSDSIGNAIWIHPDSISDIVDNSNWTRTDDTLFHNQASFVGIGTNKPTAQLEVDGNMKVMGNTLVVSESSNRVGIGTLNPASKLHVVGDVKMDGFTFNVDALNNRIGIGTEIPTHRLSLHHLENAIGGSGLNIVDVSNLAMIVKKPANINDEAVGIGFQSSSDLSNIGAAIIHQRSGEASTGKLHFATKNSSIAGEDIAIGMTLDEMGNLGIGTTSPSSELEVIGTISALDVSCDHCIDSNAIAINAISTDEIIDGSIEFQDIGQGQISGIIHIADFSITSDKISPFGLQSNAIAPDAITSFHLEPDAVRSNDIQSNAITNTHLSNDCVTQHEIENNAVRTAHIFPESITNSKLALNSVTSNRIANNSIGTRHMGEGIGIGTSSNLPADYMLLVEDNVAGFGEFVACVHNTRTNINTSESNGLLIIAGHNTYNSSEKSRFIQFQTNQSITGSIRQESGNSVTYSTLSDRRLKSDFQPSKYGLSDLMKVKVMDYHYTSNPETPENGFLAQQLYEIYPFAVNRGGEDPVKDPWMVDYGRVTPLLLKSIQDQQKQIVALELKHETEITKLENKIDELHRMIKSIKTEIE